MAVEFTRNHRTWQMRILISTYLGYGGFYLTRKVFTLCKPLIADEFGWDIGATAHIWTAFLVAYMVGQFLSSYVGRRWGPRMLLLGGLGLSMGCNLVFGFSNSFYTFLVFMAFNGLLQAAGWPGGVGAVSEWLRADERGTIMGLWSTNYMAGNIMVKSLAGLLLWLSGWRLAFFGCTLASFAIWWLMYFWQRTKPSDVGLSPLVDMEDMDQQLVAGSKEEQVSFRDYFVVALNPLILLMGTTYFSVKFLRYALDSWLPSFLTIQGLDAGWASIYSQGFDIAGLFGCVAAGYVLDKWFKGNWAALSFFMGIGVILGYLSVMYLGTSPIMIAVCFCLVGFMLYGPDMLLSAAGAIEIAGTRNSVVVAGIVNGIGSIGPVVQEQVIGFLMRGNAEQGIANTNRLALGTSIFMTVMIIPLIWQLHRVRKKQEHNQP
jgi:sugar phosphate permease